MSEILTFSPLDTISRDSTCSGGETSKSGPHRLASPSDSCFSEAKGGERDVFNERPTRDEQTVALVQPEPKKVLPTKATIHTSKGDIVSQSRL